jgi:ribosome biogenesis GTPase A
VIEEEVAVFLAATAGALPGVAGGALRLQGDREMDGIGVVEGMGIKRGFRQKGGDLDFEKASHVFLGDYRSGALGRISLETPTTRLAPRAVCCR